MKKLTIFLATILMLVFVGCSSTKNTTVRAQSQYDEVYSDSQIVDTADVKYYDESLGYGTSYDHQKNLYIQVIDPDPFYVSVYSPYYYVGYSWNYVPYYNPYYYGFGWYNPWYNPYWHWGWYPYYYPYPYYNCYNYYGYGYYGYGYHHGHHKGHYYGKRNSMYYDNVGYKRNVTNTNARNIGNRSVERVNSRVNQPQPKYNRDTRNVQSYSSPAYRQPKSSSEYMRSSTPIRNERYSSPTGTRYSTPTNRSSNLNSRPSNRYSTPTGRNEYNTGTRYSQPSNTRNGGYNSTAPRSNGGGYNVSPRNVSPSPSGVRSGGGGGGMRSSGGGGTGRR